MCVACNRAPAINQHKIISSLRVCEQGGCRYFGQYVAAQLSSNNGAEESLDLLDMPDEILFNILTNLDIDDLKRLRLANKRFEALITGERQLWTQLNLAAVTPQQRERYDIAPMEVVRVVFSEHVRDSYDPRSGVTPSSIGTLSSFVQSGHFGLVLYMHALLVARTTPTDMAWAYGHALYMIMQTRTSEDWNVLQLQPQLKKSMLWAMRHFEFSAWDAYEGAVVTPSAFGLYMMALLTAMYWRDLDLTRDFLDALPSREYLRSSVNLTGQLDVWVAPNLQVAPIVLSDYPALFRVLNISIVRGNAAMLALLLPYLPVNFYHGMHRDIDRILHTLVDMVNFHDDTSEEAARQMLVLLRDKRVREADLHFVRMRDEIDNAEIRDELNEILGER